MDVSFTAISREYQETFKGKSLWEAGVAPITHMRHFQTNKNFSNDLLEHINSAAAV